VEGKVKVEIGINVKVKVKIPVELSRDVIFNKDKRCLIGFGIYL